MIKSSRFKPYANLIIVISSTKLSYDNHIKEKTVAELSKKQESIRTPVGKV